MVADTGGVTCETVMVPMRDGVRLDLSSSEFPHLARHHNTGDDPATDERFEIARQAVHHDPSRPSYVELAVVPGLRIASR